MCQCIRSTTLPHLIPHREKKPASEKNPVQGPRLSHLAACLPCTTTTLAVGFEWYLVGKEGRKQGSKREREREAWGAGWKQGGEGGEGAWRHEGMEA